jgi:beta-glucosidase
VSRPFRDPRLSLDERVDDLLHQLTRHETIAMVHQRSPGSTRLGVAPFRTGTEALHGVAWFGPATVFPQAVGLGSTWDPQLLAEIGTAVGVEARAMQPANPTLGLNVWAPVVNLLRDPRWGRNEEGYAEDVLLTVRLAIGYCRGLAGPDPDRLLTAPLLKHFLAYNNEDDRVTTSSVVRPRVLHEYDLPVFTRTLRDGAAVGVMPSYNRVNGCPMHVHELLGLLREQTSPDLLICSDADAVTNLVEHGAWIDDQVAGHAAALLAGVDSFTFTEHRVDTAQTAERIDQALARGLITMDDVRRAVRRLLLVRLRLGEFDPEPVHHPARPEDRDSPEHRLLARRAARQQVVLLRNERGLLPLAATAGLRVAVVGPFGTELREDWYAGTMPYRVSIVDGLRAALAPRGGSVVSSCGRDLVRLVVDGRAVRTGEDGQLELAGPEAAPGGYRLSDWGGGVVTLYDPTRRRYVTRTDDGLLKATSLRPGGWAVHEAFLRTTLADGRSGLAGLPTGSPIAVLPDGTLGTTGEAAHIELEPVVGGAREAVEVARDADVALIVLGNEPMINGREIQDRSTLALPPDQQRLLDAITASHSRSALVLMSSYPYAFGPADSAVHTALWTSHAGQETGHALAEVLLGAHAPTGRLPQTWYAADADLPPLLDYDIIKSRRTYQYFEGDPLFPFGHGLTYTTFRYGQTVVDGDETTDSLTVTTSVTNTGAVPATEVVQVYGRSLAEVPDLPRRKLLGFARVALQPGATATVAVAISTEDLAVYDVARMRMRVLPGRYEVMVGRSAEAIESSTVITLTGEQAGPRPLVGVVIPAAGYDDHEGTTLVAARATGGAALAVADGGSRAWALLRYADLTGMRPGVRVVIRCARPAASPASAELRLHSPDGPLVVRLEVPPVVDRYTWSEATGLITDEALPRGVFPDHADLYLVMDGPQRLESLRLIGE